MKSKKPQSEKDIARRLQQQEWRKVLLDYYEALVEKRIARSKASIKGWQTRRRRGTDKVSQATKKRISAGLKKLHKQIKEQRQRVFQRRSKASKKGWKTRYRKLKVLNEKLQKRLERVEEFEKRWPELTDDQKGLHNQVIAFMLEVEDPYFLDEDRARQCQIEFGLKSLTDVYDIWWSPGKPSRIHEGRIE
jgi:uncharacterized protein (DUF342 family)